MNSATALKHAERPTWVDMATLSFHLCTSDRTIEMWIRQGKFPQPYQPGGKRLWRWSEVEATMAASREGVAAAESIPDDVIAAADRATRRRRR